MFCALKPKRFDLLTKRTLIFISDAKRLIGRKFEEPSVQSDMKHWPFKVSWVLQEVERRGESKKRSYAGRCVRVQLCP